MLHLRVDSPPIIGPGTRPVKPGAGPRRETSSPVDKHATDAPTWNSGSRPIMMPSGDSTPWIVRFRPQPAASLRLFCFHHAGGGASAYRPWVAGVAAGVELCAVQLPGREGRIRETPYARLADLLPAVTGAIAAMGDRPFAFFGHSLGAMLAFEIARELRRGGGRSPEHLFLSGRRAPTRPDPQPRMSHLPQSEFLTEVRSRWNGIPAAVLDEPELLQLLLPTLRADLALVETYAYVPGEPLDCPVSCFGGTEDPNAPAADLSPWEAQTRGQFTQRMFPGGHFFVQSARDQVQLAVNQGLRPVMERARR
jgi:medium-chain acyl-[acyl-carrier-protein] hydrolase